MSGSDQRHPIETRALPTWIRLENIRVCLERGMIGLAVNLFEMIDPAQAREPQVLAVGKELAKAQREIARKD